jgi:hypothetical protein
MAEKIVRYVPDAETKLNLGDGSFVDPDLAQQWVAAILEAGEYSYVGQGRFGHYRGLKDELIRRVESVVREVEGEREDGGFSGDTHVDLEGGPDVDVDWHNATIHLGLTAFSPNYLFEDRQFAENIEAQTLQDQAFVSYRLAERMVETVKKLEELKHADAVAAQAKQAAAAVKAAV